MTQKVLPSNPLVAVSDNGAPITSDGGNVLLSMFLNSPVVSRLFNNVEFNDNRKNPRYAKVELLLQMLIQVIEGYRNDDVADYLTQDIEHRLVYAQNMASQPTISRFLSHLTNEDIDELQELNRRIVSLIDERSANTELVLDLDSTYFETFGHQEKIGFNYHYWNIGYHPLIMTDALTGTVRQASLRSGNTYTGNGATEFVQGYLSTSLSDQHQTIILRGDSGFATPDLMKTLEGNNIFYTIRLKSNPRLKRMALDGRYVNLDNLLMIEGQLTTDEFEYQAASWDKARRVIVLNDEHGGTQFIVTNLSLPQKDIVRVYRKRAAIEDIIRELKSGFAFGKTDSSSFFANKARMWISVIASNLMRLMKSIALDDQQQSWTINTFRDRLLKIGGRVLLSTPAR
ncbi:IS1380 family transposase [Weissella hellenica]|uniref:IS1380 family transposase n=1 Tax=Weissella hellenica TaxID=46256 RepID=UPI0038882AC0